MIACSRLRTFITPTYKKITDYNWESFYISLLDLKNSRLYTKGRERLMLKNSRFEQ